MITLPTIIYSMGSITLIVLFGVLSLLGIRLLVMAWQKYRSDLLSEYTLAKALAVAYCMSHDTVDPPVELEFRGYKIEIDELDQND